MTQRFWRALVCTAILSLASHTFGDTREWSDASGNFKIRGTLLAANDDEAVIKLDKPEKGRELLAVSLSDLSEQDREYVLSQEADNEFRQQGEKHSWELKNGLNVFGRAVSFVQKDLSLQRRRGKLYVNDRLFDNLPEIYQKMLPYIVGHFENRTFNTKRQFDDWVVSQRTKINTYSCEALVIEFPNGDEYAVPLFFFTSSAMASLKSAYEQWQADLKVERSAEEQAERQRQHDLYLQSRASAYQQQQTEMMEIARMQLLMNSVQAGVTSLWEVYMFPGPGVVGFPLSVVVPGRDSNQASFIAMQNNPGYVVGPIRRFSGF
ncbi:hypothetical protein SH449x_004696 [Pirellulaceae bacterium SH449]